MNDMFMRGWLLKDCCECVVCGALQQKWSKFLRVCWIMIHHLKRYFTIIL